MLEPYDRYQTWRGEGGEERPRRPAVPACSMTVSSITVSSINDFSMT
ncbi:hypothetical protein [Streptomyces sp. SID3212]|nr:hypothetical protein [Streptomyces sp. SID3212]MYV53313.1 hypothetical protein [Streptomyces sp. SID3212]